MALSEEWTERHLTPRGWELGSEKTDFSLEGAYDVWMKVNKGELDGSNAIMQRQLQFKGNMSNIIRYSKSFLRLFQLMQKVPVDY